MIPVCEAFQDSDGGVIVRCPFCGKLHFHGDAGSGSRLSHCLKDARTYELRVVEERFPNPCLVCTYEGAEDPPCGRMYDCLPFLNAAIPEAEYSIRRALRLGDLSHYMLQCEERNLDIYTRERKRLLAESGR